MNRREFLKLSSQAGLVGGAGALLGINAVSAMSSDKGPKRFFVLVKMEGGWDVTLGLDPWLEAELPDEKEMFVEYRPDDLLTTANGIKLGPAAEPLMAHGTDISIINGVFMSSLDNGHPASERYISAGSTLPLVGDLPVEMALATDFGPFGVIHNDGVYVGGRNAITSKTDDLVAVKDQNQLDDLQRAFPDLSRKTALIRAVKSLLSNSNKIEAFNGRLKEIEKNGKEIEPADVLAAAFVNGTAYFGEFIVDTDNLDSHGNHPGQHLNSQKGGWENVSQLFQLFKNTPFGGAGDSLFDHTTFMVVSEFARTPALNAAKGKDHNPNTNSVLIAGAGFQKGKVIGGSRLLTRQQTGRQQSRHIAYPIDFSTGEVVKVRRPGVSMVFPDHVGKTVAEIVGVPLDKFKPVPSHIDSLPGLI